MLLGELAAEVVFIGGAIAPLLQTDPPFDEARPTKDVDGVIATNRYADTGRIAELLRAKGFSQAVGETNHIHRWYSPAKDPLDLVPAGAHPGGGGQKWDAFALANSRELDLGDGVKLRYADAPSFLALKFAAYADRGSEDPHVSHDLEDIFALIASRPTLVEETSVASRDVQEFLVAQLRGLLDDSRLKDLLAGHLNNAQDPAVVSATVMARMKDMASL